MAWHSPKNSVHTAGGGVMRQCVDTKFQGAVSIVISSAPVGLIGFPKMGRLKISGHGGKAKVAYRLAKHLSLHNIKVKTCAGNNTDDFRITKSA
jgi:hypothetical protein